MTTSKVFTLAMKGLMQGIIERMDISAFRGHGHFLRANLLNRQASF